MFEYHDRVNLIRCVELSAFVLLFKKIRSLVTQIKLIYTEHENLAVNLKTNKDGERQNVGNVGMKTSNLISLKLLL